MFRITCLLLLLFYILILASCGILGFSTPTITLWTNQIQIIAYIEEFNAQYPHYKVEILYVQSPQERLLSANDKPDLILADFLSSPSYIALFEPLDTILNEQNINIKNIYKDLLHLGVYGSQHVLLPFSFDLPAIVYRKESEEQDISNFTISLNLLKEKSKDFNIVQEGKLNALGFSPLWNSDFLFSAMSLLGTDFKADAEAILIWNETALANSIDFLRSWFEQAAYGYKREREFTKKYIYEPMYKLIQDKRFGYYRISFFLTSASEFFKIPKQKRENLDFRWLCSENKIPVNNNILYFGIPKGAKNIEGGYEFLKWIFNPHTQEKYLEISSSTNLNIFGISRGFSSLISVNEQNIPQYFPILLGRIPTEDFFLFPNPLPDNWQILKKEVIWEWFLEVFSSIDEAPLLKERLK